MHLVAAPETHEGFLVAAVPLVHVAAARAGLARVGGVHLGGGDPEPLLQVAQLVLDDLAPAVAQDRVQAPRQVGVAEVQPLQHQFARLPLLHEAVQYAADFRAQEAAHILDQRPVPLAVAWFPTGALLTGGNHRDQRVVPLQPLQPPLAEQLALAGREQRGQPEVQRQHTMAVVVGAALGADFAHVGDNAEGQAPIPFVHLDAVGDAARTFGMVVAGQQRDGDLPALLQRGQIHPPADLAALRRLDGPGDAARAVVEAHGDARQVWLTVPGHAVAHDGARQPPDGLGDDLAAVLHHHVAASEPRAQDVDGMEHVLGDGRQRTAVHRVTELVGSVADPTLQLPDDLPARHLDAVGRADNGGESHLVHVVVLVESTRLEEQPPLLAAQQHRALAVSPQQRQHRRLLARRQVGRQQVGAVDGRVLGLGADHQAAPVSAASSLGSRSLKARSVRAVLVMILF